jgi:hypothetical protein
MKLEMNQQFKKKFAREILIFLGSAGMMLLALLSIWIYSLPIHSHIKNNYDKINFLKTEAASLSAPYNSKVESMGKLINACDFSTGNSSVTDYFEKKSNITLSENNKHDLLILRRLQGRYVNNIKMPSKQEYLEYKECFNLLNNYTKSFSSVEHPFEKAWTCLIDMKDHLLNWMPINTMKEFGFNTSADLVKYIQVNTVNYNDEANNIKAKEMLAEVKILQKQTVVSYAKITTARLTGIFMTTMLFILALAYPVRLLVIACIWALRNYK